MQLFSWTLAGVLLLILHTAVTIHIILHKDDVPSAIGWTGLVWLAPVVGCIVYVIFGINRVRRKAQRLNLHGATIFKAIGKTPEEIQNQIPAPLWQMLRLGYKVHPQHLTLRNTIRPLINGDEAYPLMCSAIASAKKEVLIASYIFNNDKAGQRFLPALRTAVQNGAKVRMLIDGVGLNYSKPTITSAVKKIKGVEFSVFLPSKRPINLPFVNLRNHRKMMVIDGQTAFFGGMNVAVGNLVQEHPKDPIQDVTFEAKGPVVHQIAKLFEEDWVFSGKKPFLPTVPHAYNPSGTGTTAARIIPDGPDGDYGKIENLCLGALACAQKTATIVTPYFLPENNILSALETAAMRGVEVEIILPQKSNIFGMDWAMQANFERLLKKGVKIYRAEPPFDHSKLFLVDDLWLFAGSANWDVRSFKLNFESNMECFDPKLAQEVRLIMEQKKKKAHLVPYAKHSCYTILTALRNNLFRLLTPYY